MFIHAEREFKILDQLKGNRNIIQGVDYIPEFLRSRGYLVMEKIEGSSLLNYVIENGPVNEEDAKVITRQIVESVKFMHERGVVHRDMNPTNVFIVDDKTKFVKILDFNISKLIDDFRQRNSSLDLNEVTDEEVKGVEKKRVSMSIERERTKYSMFTKTGTPIYSAPEIHTAFKYTELIDMWGVGTILFTILMGEPPFNEPSIPELLKKVSSADYDRSSPQWASLSPDA